MASIYTSMDVMKFHLKNADLNSFKSVFERHYTKVIKEINRLEKTMDHILVLGHLDTGKIVFKPEPVDLKQLIEKIIQEYLLFLENRKAKLLVKGEPKILDIDSNFMHYIVTNLIDNAFKFGSPDEEPQVLLSFEKNAVSLSVEDSGIGIPSEEIHKLFDSFYRASNTECTPGTGLGLVIVKRLTELHGGEVFVKSELNGGTVFTITLPNGTHEK
jgi:signal transduction histidine kinase